MIKKIFAPLLAAAIWGTAFVAQSMGAEFVPPFAFNAARSVVAVITLSVILLIANQIRHRRGHVEKPSGGKKALLLGGLCCGTAMAVATGLQQIGLGETDAGKASFITALYIVLVPIFGLFFKKKVSLLTAFSVAITVAGMYLLCVKDGLTIQGSDVYIIFCGVVFAVQILCIDHFAPQTDPIALSLAQFSVMAIESAILSVLFEKTTIDTILLGLMPILYLGILSSGVAYTLQIVAQKGSDPTLVSLLLSLESVFGAIAGAILLQERMTGREYFGCALMLLAVVLSQIPTAVIKKWITRKSK